MGHVVTRRIGLVVKTVEVAELGTFRRELRQTLNKNQH